MSFARKRKGKLGEQLAEAYLKYHGFRLVERNWSCRNGELDLIVRRGRDWRFVEVKYRTSTEFGFPEEAITETKYRHLRKAVETYLLSAKSPPKRYQIDVISILKIGQHKPEIRWIQGI